MDLPNKSEPTIPKKKIEPIVSGVVQVPRPATRRFFDYLFAESPKALGAKIGRDVIVPRLKAGFEEAANSFLAGMLWGNGSRPMNNIVQGTVLRAGGTNYHQISSLPSPQTQAMAANETRSTGGNYKDLVCPTQQHAETLLAGLFDLHNRYRVVTVADLYELASITPAISDGSYGWHSLDGARISKVRDGYLLELPRPVLI